MLVMVEPVMTVTMLFENNPVWNRFFGQTLNYTQDCGIPKKQRVTYAVFRNLSDEGIVVNKMLRLE